MTVNKSMLKDGILDQAKGAIDKPDLPKVDLPKVELPKMPKLPNPFGD